MVAAGAQGRPEGLTSGRKARNLNLFVHQNKPRTPDRKEFPIHPCVKIQPRRRSGGG